MFSRQLTSAGLILLLAGFVTFASGCGPNYKARATVKGKVSDGHRALTSGTVMFWGQDGVTASTSIDTEGNYVMPDAPIGEVKITVTVALPPPKTLEAMKNAPLAKVPTQVLAISDKYAKVETTPLTYKVEKGEHVHNIELSP